MVRKHLRFQNGTRVLVHFPALVGVGPLKGLAGSDSFFELWFICGVFLEEWRRCKANLFAQVAKVIEHPHSHLALLCCQLWLIMKDGLAVVASAPRGRVQLGTLVVWNEMDPCRGRSLPGEGVWSPSEWKPVLDGERDSSWKSWLGARERVSCLVFGPHQCEEYIENLKAFQGKTSMKMFTVKKLKASHFEQEEDVRMMVWVGSARLSSVAGDNPKWACWFPSGQWEKFLIGNALQKTGSEKAMCFPSREVKNKLTTVSFY